MKEKGFKINIKDKDGFTPIMFACHYGHLNIFNKLLKVKGVNINMRTYNGKTCLMLAAQKGHIKIVNKLLSLGAKTQFKERKRTKRSCRTRTAYNMARMCGHNNIVKKLSKKKMVKKQKLSLKNSNNKQKGGSSSNTDAVCLKEGGDGVNCKYKYIGLLKLILDTVKEYTYNSYSFSEAVGPAIQIEFKNKKFIEFLNKIKFNKVLETYIILEMQKPFKTKDGREINSPTEGYCYDKHKQKKEDCIKIETKIVDKNISLEIAIQTKIMLGAVLTMALPEEIKVNLTIQLPIIKIYTKNTDSTGNAFKLETEMKITFPIKIDLVDIAKILSIQKKDTKLEKFKGVMLTVGAIFASRQGDIQRSRYLFNTYKENLFILIGLACGDKRFKEAETKVEKYKRYDDSNIADIYKHILIELYNQSSSTNNPTFTQNYETFVLLLDKEAEERAKVEEKEITGGTGEIVGKDKIISPDTGNEIKDLIENLVVMCDHFISENKVEYKEGISGKNMTVIINEEYTIKGFMNMLKLSDNNIIELSLTIYYNTGVDYLSYLPQDSLPPDLMKIIEILSK